ncbi:MAG TPA: outer membrane protein assembly factor BamE [Burkholderiaceae bacterium]|nr:outer membrane protein assembly factor BamE [Burkholderiaceae bacterium]
MFHRLPRTAALLAGLTLVAGCQSVSDVGSGMASSMSAVTGWAPTFLGPYRPDVHQGNIITQEMVDQLRQGMTREQVRFMLGTPLLTSDFHKDRWDYPYYLNPLRGPVQNRRLTIFFENNKLVRFVSDEMPPEAMADAMILGPNARKAPKVAPRQQAAPVGTQTPPPTRE